MNVFPKLYLDTMTYVTSRDSIQVLFLLHIHKLSTVFFCLRKKLLSTVVLPPANVLP